eukprot:COSAG06_NODE_6470_length_2922_cov_1.191286_4_plen_215_part_00
MRGGAGGWPGLAVVPGAQLTNIDSLLNYYTQAQQPSPHCYTISQSASISAVDVSSGTAFAVAVGGPTVGEVMGDITSDLTDAGDESSAAAAADCFELPLESCHRFLRWLSSFTSERSLRCRESLPGDDAPVSAAAAAAAAALAVCQVVVVAVAVGTEKLPSRTCRLKSATPPAARIRPFTALTVKRDADGPRCCANTAATFSISAVSSSTSEAR